MNRPIVKIHNIENDEIIEREMNDAEFKDYQANEKFLSEREAEKAALAAQKQALLDRLGITEAEARLLIG